MPWVCLVFQLLSRIPIVTVLQATVLMHLLLTSTEFTWIWLVILAITAGLFEEVGRYVGYRLFLRREPKTWSKAVMFGLGHGGLESMVVVGGQIVLNAINTLMLLTINANTLPVAQSRISSICSRTSILSHSGFRSFPPGSGSGHSHCMWHLL